MATLPSLNLNQALNSGGLSVGVKAVSPAAKITPPTNTLPATQAITPKDLSGSYANVSGTIYNKTTGQAYSKPEEFFGASGVNSFNNLKFDTAWQPPKINTPVPTPSAPTTTLPSLATTTQNTTQATDASPPAPAPYTPPNGGTTGVSQGGIVGNQINNAISNPSLDKARADLLELQNNYGKERAAIHSRPSGLSIQSGQEGILNQLYATKLAAAQTGVSNALQGQSNTTSGLASAGSLNAPQFVSPGQVQVSPTQPNPGSTTSGASNLNSLVGQRPGASGVTEFFNKSTGQGFPTPQALADFVNQQIPGANANAQNVFQILQQQGQGGSNLLGLDANTLNTYAQMLATGQGNAIPGNVTGNTALMAQLVQRAKAINPNFDVNTAAGIGAANQSNAAITGTADVNANNSIYQKALADYSELKVANTNIKQFGDQVLANIPKGTNPTDSTIVNGTIQNFMSNFASDPQYAKLATNIQGLQARVSALLGTGEIPSAATAGAQQIISGALPIASMAAVLSQIEAEGSALENTKYRQAEDAKFNLTGANKPPTANNNALKLGNHTLTQDANGNWVSN